MDNKDDMTYSQFDSLDKKTMESIDSFIKLTGMAVSYFDKGANLKWESHNNKKMCAFCKAYDDEESLCRMNLKYSGDIASQLGESYIFLCKARLTLIAFPVIINNEHIGTFFAGPIILGKLRSNVVDYILKRNLNNQADILLKLNEVKVFEPKIVSAIANIFGNCIYASIHTSPQYENITDSFKKAQKVSEKIQTTKRDNSDAKSSYPINIEKDLVDAIVFGDMNESMELTHKYLDAITLFNVGDIGLIKLDIIQMFGLILRKVENNGVLLDNAKDKYDFQLDKINKSTNIAELSSVVADLTELITTLFEAGIYMGDVDIIKKTINYISRNYSEKISLKSISENLHISTPYLSTLFKKEMGKTFSDFLTGFRIKKSEALLAETTTPLTEIATMSGFEDQSYFNKVFKKNIGITPKQYRNKMSKK